MVRKSKRVEATDEREMKEGLVRMDVRKGGKKIKAEPENEGTSNEREGKQAREEWRKWRELKRLGTVRGRRALRELKRTNGRTDH
eukprot:6181247-Pleurochrysis_carterae.AAC.4